MSRELHACLVRYFARLEKLDEKWKELSATAERPLEALFNQAEQFQHIVKWVTIKNSLTILSQVGMRWRDCCSVNIDETENSMDAETRERLIFKILMGLEDEIALLLNILTQFNDANQVWISLSISYNLMKKNMIF